MEIFDISHAQQVQLRSLLARAHGENIRLSAVNDSSSSTCTCGCGKSDASPPQEGRVEAAQFIQFTRNLRTTPYETHAH
jgi:hypothetical protein